MEDYRFVLRGLSGLNDQKYSEDLVSCLRHFIFIDPMKHFVFGKHIVDIKHKHALIV